MLSDTMMLGGGRKAAYSIENSLLFRGGQYLSRTFGTPTNAQKATISVWVRRGGLGPVQDIVGSSSGAVLRFGSSTSGTVGGSGTDQITLCGNSGGAYVCTTSAVFRDPSAWLHILAVLDSTESTGNRVKLWVNGILQAWSVYAEPTSGALFQAFVSGATLYFGSYDGANNFLGGELAEPVVIDGQALPPTKFGEFDPITGSWRPKRVQNVDFGANGFYLGKSWSVAGSVNDLGTDYSGKGNHWTPSGFVVSDVLKDSPTNVYATLNPLSPHNTGLTLSAGNLAVTTGGSSAGPVYNYSSLATMPFPTTGKYAYRVVITSRSTTGVAVGLAKSDFTPTGASLAGSSSVYVYEDTGKRYSAGGGAAFGSTVSVGQAIDIAFDATSGNAWVGIYNGSTTTWQGSGDPVAGVNPTFTGLTGQSFWPWVEATAASALVMITVDFGQRGYVPPSGFKALCTANLPTPVSAAAKRPGKYYSCQTVVHNGSGTAVTLGWDAVAADWLVRIKSLGSGDWHYIDTKRGLDKVLIGNSTQAGITNAAMVTNRTASGFVLGSGLAAATYLVEAWRVAPEAGFDIVTYTGTGGARRIAHHNGAVPALIVCRNGGTAVSSGNWFAKHSALPTGYNLYLNNAVAAWPLNNSASGGLSDLDSSATFGVSAGSSDANNLNELGQNYVAYVWSEVPGFSKFGSHVGNGAQDGPFDWLGFSPGSFVLKRLDASGYGWFNFTGAENSGNPVTKWMIINTTGAEESAYQIDFTAIGAKVRADTTNYNASGGTYITAAWAAHPLGAKRVTPATAR